MHERSRDFTNGRAPRGGAARAPFDRPTGAAAIAPAATPPAFSARRQLAVAAALVVLAFAVMPPASSAGLSFWAGLVFHGLHVFPASLVAYLLSGWLFARRRAARWPAWALLALAGALAGVALAPCSVTLELLFGVFDATDGATAPLPATWPAWRQELADEVLTVPLKTAVLWPAMNLLVLWRAAGLDRDRDRDRDRDSDGGDASPRTTAPAAAAATPAQAIVAPTAGTAVDVAPSVGSPAPAPSTPPPESPVRQVDGMSAAATWLDRLPARLGRNVVHLEAQEHYLRVVTTRGSHLMLQGLSNAVADLARIGADGVQLHRSRWVAWAHVARVDARARVLAVWLHDGTRLSIGRRRARDVADAWARRGGDAG